MGNTKSSSNRFHDIIRTAHVLIEEDQVFIKDEMPEPYSGEVAEWFPTDFKWVPAQL